MTPTIDEIFYAKAIKNILKSVRSPELKIMILLLASEKNTAKTKDEFLVELQMIFDLVKEEPIEQPKQPTLFFGMLDFEEELLNY